MAEPRVCKGCGRPLNDQGRCPNPKCPLHRRWLEEDQPTQSQHEAPTSPPPLDASVELDLSELDAAPKISPPEIKASEPDDPIRRLVIQADEKFPWPDFGRCTAEGCGERLESRWKFCPFCGKPRVLPASTMRSPSTTSFPAQRGNGTSVRRAIAPPAPPPERPAFPYKDPRREPDPPTLPRVTAEEVRRRRPDPRADDDAPFSSPNKKPGR